MKHWGSARAPWFKVYSLLCATLAGVGLAGCGPALPPIDGVDTAGVGDTARDQTVKSHGLATGEHLLFRPRGAGEELLGREVTRGEQGQLLIADELKPGCSVVAKPVKEVWNRQYDEELQRVATGGADLGELLKLRAEHDASVRMQVQIKNQQVVQADISGDCGALYIKAVRVGTGSRRLVTAASTTGSAESQWVPVGASGAAKDSEQTFFEWPEPQAWSFTVGEAAKDSGLQVEASMPEQVTHGEEYWLNVTVSTPAWLVVYYEEENGSVGKMLPKQAYDEVFIEAGESKQLGAFAASLRNPGKAANEFVVIHAFDAHEYLKQLRYPLGSVPDQQMKSWVDELAAKLDKIPTRRRATARIGYQIVPAAH